MTDPRTGPTESGTVTIASGDGNTPQTVLDVPSDALFRVERVTVEYAEAATAADTVVLADNADGTANGDIDDQRDRFELSSSGGDSIDRENRAMRDFENDVLAHTSGSHDADVHVTVEGTLIRYLEDTMASR